MRYVICVRNPCAVVASLTDRDEHSRLNAEWLWLAYMRALLADTGGHPRLFVFYEDLLEDWLPETRRMAAFVGEPARAEDPRVHDAVRAFLEREMCHHPVSMEDLARDERVSFQTVSLAFALRAYARPLAIPFNDADDPQPAARGVHQALDLFADRALAAWTRSAALTAAQQTQALRDRSSLAAHARATMTASAPGATVDRYVQAHEYEAALRAIDDIHTSRAWQTVTRLHDISARLLPAGTRRQRVFARAWSRITTRRRLSRKRRVADLPVL
jgi:hypothetical protein